MLNNFFLYNTHNLGMWFANDPCTSLYYCNGVVVKSVKTMFVVDVIKKAPKGILIVNKEKVSVY